MVQGEVMRIYVGHSSSMDFEEKIYKPIRDSELNKRHEVVLPHEDSDELFDSRSFFEEGCDLFVAEVSQASTGLGIEMGWADQLDVEILCVHSEEVEPSGSIRAVTDNVRTYSDRDELVEVIESFVEKLR